MVLVSHSIHLSFEKQLILSSSHFTHRDNTYCLSLLLKIVPLTAERMSAVALHLRYCLSTSFVDSFILNPHSFSSPETHIFRCFSFSSLSSFYSSSLFGSILFMRFLYKKKRPKRLSHTNFFSIRNSLYFSSEHRQRPSITGVEMTVDEDEDEVKTMMIFLDTLLTVS